VPNGYSGYSEISVFGTPAVTPPAGPEVTGDYETNAVPTWVPGTPNLIAGQLPSSVGPGSFTLQGAGGLAALTDGAIGTTPGFSATCGGTNDGAGTSVTYTANEGWVLTNIVVYTGWTNYGRAGQFYYISYSTLAAPTTFIPLASVGYNPSIVVGPPAETQVIIAPPAGQTELASNVAAVNFDFTPQGTQDFGYSAYTEIILLGSNLTVPKAPVVKSPSISGGNLILTGTGGTPNSSYTILTTTNLLTPLADWTVSTTGTLDGNGAFSNSIPLNSSQPTSFFKLKVP
jgi:hypothetical protein